MGKDFTVKKYEEFLKAALENDYQLVSFQEFLNTSYKKVLVLRHDVDKKPLNSLKTAELQNRLGATGTYYFRATKESFNIDIIKKIRDLGHEIGYHYEDLSIFRGDSKKAIAHFEKWLKKFKEIYPVKTICMHGSPMSKWDNRKIWETYDYKDYGIVAEPYFDVDFNKVYYLTDTGRRWDGNKVSVRDKVNSTFDLSFHSTDELIATFQNQKMPHQIMQNIHPQRWTDNATEWQQERIMQAVKNQLKRILFVKNEKA